MAFANGRVPTKNLAPLPLAFSNKREQEYLTTAAYASLVRMMLRAVAETGSYFSVWDAYRSMAEQVAMLEQNYTRVSRGRSKSSDRTYGGSTWALKAGRPLTASPGHSNHGNGLAVDIHPAAIQTWMKGNAARFGWVNDVPSEPWHWSYLNPGRDQYRSEGLPNVKGMQQRLGIDQDGKPGPGFVTAVKAFQKQHGLTVDGKAGPATAKAILGKGDAALSVPVTPAGGASVPVPTPDETVLELAPLPAVERDRTSPNTHKGRVDPRDGTTYTVKHITVHWWGEPKDQAFDGIVAHLCNPGPEVSAHYVISPTRAAQLLDEADSSWANGNRVANFESITIECDPNDVVGTLPVLAALIRDIRSRHGDLPVYPHSHWVSTVCCGDYEPHLDAVEDLARTGATIVSAPPTVPSTGGQLPTGKALLMHLKDVPEFPLLRTPGHKCYYGDAAGPIESVSGKSENSLNPGEIETVGGKTRSKGLMILQRQLVKRGYSVDVDGRWGAQMDNAIDNLQRLAGLTRDKKCGPTTWYAAWLLPVVA